MYVGQKRLDWFDQVNPFLIFSGVVFIKISDEQNRTSFFAWVKQNRQAARKALRLNNDGCLKSNIDEQSIGTKYTRTKNIRNKKTRKRGCTNTLRTVRTQHAKFNPDPLKTAVRFWGTTNRQTDSSLYIRFLRCFLRVCLRSYRNTSAPSYFALVDC